jgi:hypothetical protein
LAAVANAAPPTFYKDVFPILQNRCQNCHRAGEAAPMPLMTYAEARPWAKSIKAAVLAKKMPPWFADPKYGKFSNDLSLPPAERDTLVAWVDAGAPSGDLSEAPPAKKFSTGWRMRTPDVIFEMPETFEVPANGVLSYQYFSVPTRFTEDKWVEMVEVRPGERSVVHHAIVQVDTGEGWIGRQYLAGYAPGSVPQVWKPGQARLIKAGSSLIFQMHYTTNGKPARDRTRVGLVFAKQPAKEQIVAMTAQSQWIEIPAGDPNHRVDSSVTMRESVKLVGMRPHMHLRGKSFLYRAVYPTGEIETLLSVPRYSFAWQPYYYLETPKLLPRGTRIECVAHYDNSANNPFNPDPSVNVRWGPQSWDEMMIGWLDVAIPAGDAPEPAIGFRRSR